MQITLKMPRPHEGQRIIIDNAKRFNVISCGRRFGKTTLGGNIMAPHLLESGKPVAWFAPTYRLLEEAFREHRRIFERVIKRSTTSPAPRLELITGGTIDYWTLDDPSTVARGRKYSTVVIDEAAMARHLELAWTQAIRPTLTDYKGSAYFLSTPRGRNYFSTLFDQADQEDQWARFQMPTTANPYIDPAEVDAASKSLPSIAFRQEYLAEFVDASGARIKREWIRHGSRKDINDVFMGVDLAISTKDDADYTAIVVISRDDDGKLYVLDSARVRSSFNEVLIFVKQMAEKWSPKMIGIENVQYQAAVIQELLRTTRLPVRGIRPDRDKVTRFAPLEARYEQGLIYHDPTLPSWFLDEVLSFPVGMHDDSIDAFAYAWQIMDGKRSFFAAD